ncbi:MAG: type III-B CRISPR module-associated protein Cmr3, partial [Actinomycetota bacterium]
VGGALRAAFARELGWTGGNWNESIRSSLGNYHDLGPLRFMGPYLSKGEELLFPAPLHLLRSGERLAYLKPGGDGLHTDIGTVRLPEIEPSAQEIKGLKPLESAYLTKRGMERALRGELPDQKEILEAPKLWKSEPRVGIQRDPTSRTTKEDALYQATHVRLEPGVALMAGVGGYDGSAPVLATLGGESRMVGLKTCGPLPFPEAPALEPENGALRYTVTLITPARIEGSGRREPGGRLEGLPGKIVSACVGKPVMIGGWDSVNKRPLDLVPHLPPGSTWFIEASAKEAGRVREMHTRHIGEKGEWGYGQILIGAWR